MWRRSKYLKPPDEARAADEVVTPSSADQRGLPLWEFADIGFDTEKKLWFLQLWNSENQSVGFYYGKKISLDGCAIQYQWKDTERRQLWHVRERFLASEFESFRVDKNGDLVIDFKKNHPRSDGQIPKDFAYLQYAYHLKSKNDNIAPTGFVEFCSQNGEIVGRLNNRWIIVEDAKRVTMGEPPGIRIRVNREDIGKIVVGRSSVIITGRDDGSGGVDVFAPSSPA